MRRPSSPAMRWITTGAHGRPTETARTSASARMMQRIRKPRIATAARRPVRKRPFARTATQPMASWRRTTSRQKPPRSSFWNPPRPAPKRQSTTNPAPSAVCPPRERTAKQPSKPESRSAMTGARGHPTETAPIPAPASAMPRTPRLRAAPAARRPARTRLSARSATANTARWRHTASLPKKQRRSI